MVDRFYPQSTIERRSAKLLEVNAMGYMQIYTYSSDIKVFHVGNTLFLEVRHFLSTDAACSRELLRNVLRWQRTGKVKIMLSLQLENNLYRQLLPELS